MRTCAYVHILFTASELILWFSKK